MYDPALSFWSINSTGLLHPSCRPLWPPRISSAALAERLLWLGVEVRGWWDLLLMLWCVVNTFNYCCHCSWWLNGLPMGVPLGFMISETNGGPFEVIGIYIIIYIIIYIYIINGLGDWNPFLRDILYPIIQLMEGVWNPWKDSEWLLRNFWPADTVDSCPVLSHFEDSDISIRVFQEISKRVVFKTLLIPFYWLVKDSHSVYDNNPLT